jgi:hypothetical protein
MPGRVPGDIAHYPLLHMYANPTYVPGPCAEPLSPTCHAIRVDRIDTAKRAVLSVTGVLDLTSIVGTE